MHANTCSYSTGSHAGPSNLKALREAGIDGSIIYGVFVGVRNNTPDLQATAVTREWMSRIRDRFAYHVVRRTIDSVDHAGHKLWPCREHVLKLEMYRMLRSFRQGLGEGKPDR